MEIEQGETELEYSLTKSLRQPCRENPETGWCIRVVLNWV